MSLIPRTIPFSTHLLPIHSPGPPESYVCSPSFGQDILPLDCQIAVNLNWPKGTTPVHYYFREPAASNAIRLPVHDHYGSCTVSIESAGPPLSEYERVFDKAHPFLNYFSIMPDKLRGLAGYLIQTCAREQGGLGGFVTLRFSAVESWLENLALSKNEVRDAQNATTGRPNDGGFLTISITNPTGFAFNPGDTDPSIAARLAIHAANLSEQCSAQEMPARKAYFRDIAAEMREKTERMSRGRSDGEKWWQQLDGDGNTSWGLDSDDDMDDTSSTGSSPEGGDAGADDDAKGGRGKTNGKADDPGSSDNEMFYDCDSTLGSPTALDCEKLSWSGLKPPDAVETLTPGVPKIYTQGTCALGISTAAAAPTTITWAHLLAAFETLNTLCVQNPFKGVRGGRAFFGKQGAGAGMGGWKMKKKRRRSWSSWSGSRSRMGKRDKVDGVSGASALPVGINATVWRHTGEGTDTKVLECEWGKAMGRVDVRGC